MNCCCDTDCTQADIQAFSECTSLPSKYKLDKDVDYWNCTNSNLVFLLHLIVSLYKFALRRPKEKLSLFLIELSSFLINLEVY